MKIREKHPLWLRLTHWIQFPALFLMIWSGLLIYWANDVYAPFFPKAFYDFFRIDHRLAEGMAIHFTFGWIVTLNGLVYLAFFFASGHFREIFPDRRTFPDLPATVLHDLGLARAAPPQKKFNAAQKLAYSSAIAIGVFEVLSGFAIYKPVQLGWLRAAFGGYETARLVHFIGMLALAAFIALHLIQVARAGWNNLRSMIAGFEAER